MAGGKDAQRGSSRLHEASHHRVETDQGGAKRTWAAHPRSQAAKPEHLVIRPSCLCHVDETGCRLVSCLHIARLSGLHFSVDSWLMTPIGQQPAGQAPSLSFNGNSIDNNADSLASNNPFRNFRAASPSHLNSFPTTPTSPFDDPMPSSRPLSRNPFLDQPLAPRPADVAAAAKTQSLTAEEIFVRLPVAFAAHSWPLGTRGEGLDRLSSRPSANRWLFTKYRDL